MWVRGFEGSSGDYWEGGQREEVGSIAFRWVGWCGSFQAAAAALAAYSNEGERGEIRVL
jgi:hypothetical protein